MSHWHHHHDGQADPPNWWDRPNLPSGNLGNKPSLQLDLKIMVGHIMIESTRKA